MKSLPPSLALFLAVSACIASAQVTLTGTFYTEDFNDISAGLPTGWTVYINATDSSLGTLATFNTSALKWQDGGSSDTSFRNVSSDNIDFNNTTATQSANSDRALGWRPVGSGSESTPYREGSVMFSIANTTNFENFSVSIELFTVNPVASSISFQLEYRVGDSGVFTSLASYTTPGASSSQFENVVTLAANSVTLSALDDQTDPVYIRLRGVSTANTGNLDLIGIDNFSLTFSAVPEPSTYAAFVGLAVLGFAVHRRHRHVDRRPAALAA